MRVQLRKICISEDGLKTCRNQGTSTCNKCGINAGQKFREHKKRDILFSSQPISTLLKRLIGD